MEQHPSHQYAIALEEPQAAAARISPLRAFIALILVAAAACSTGVEAPTSESPAPVVVDSIAADTSFLLPDHPPDYSPPDLYETVDTIWQAPVDVMAVVFISGLSRAHKTRLVADVGAYELVGGAPLHEGMRMDGFYMVRIHTDGTMGPLLEAIEVLRESPDIVTAFTLTRLGPPAPTAPAPS